MIIIIKINIRGKAVSHESNIKGIKQFPNLLIKNGVVIKRIIKNICLIEL